MRQLLIILAALLELLRQFLPALGRLRYLAVICTVIDHILHAHNLALIDALHAVQVVDAKVADRVRVITVQIDQCFKAILLARIEEPKVVYTPQWSAKKSLTK